MSIFDLFPRRRITKATSSHEGDAEAMHITEQVNPTMRATQKDWYCLFSINYILNPLVHVEHLCYNRTTNIVLPWRCCKHPRAWTNLVGGSSMDILHPNSDSLKTCRDCQRALPATAEYFHRDKASKDGLFSRCKECNKARKRAYYAEHKEQVKAREKEYIAKNREKVAARKKQYAAAHQAELKAYKKAHYAAHREENKARSKRWYAEHKQYASEYSKRYRAENQEKKREQDRKYREEHAEEKRERDRKYREAHTQERNAYQRRYYTEHVEEVLTYIKQYNQTERGIIAKRSRTHNRRARKKNAPGSHTTEELYQQLKRQKGKCYYCGVKLSTSRDSWNADHIIPLSRGGSNDVSNIVIACPRCNRKKNDKLPHEWTDGGRLI